MAPQGFEDKVSFVWKVADKLRGTFKQHEYGSVMLPLLVLRRMDAVLADTKDDVLALHKTFDSVGPAQEMMLKSVAKQRFYNSSRFTFSSLLSDDKALADNLSAYIRAMSSDAYAVMEAYNFDDKIARMERAGILYHVVADFADLDLRPSVVSNEAMGYIFEDLLRRFSEMSNETAGEHYTPREVIRLMVELLVGGEAHRELVESPIPVRTVYAQGKVYSAYFNTVLMLDFHRYLRERRSPHYPEVLVIDSPLKGFHQGRAEAAGSMREGLFSYLPQEATHQQIIILTNTDKVPGVNRANMGNLIEFSTDTENSRYGYLKDVIHKGMTKRDLRKATGLSSATIAKTGCDETVTTQVLARVCGALDREVADIVEVVPADIEKGEEDV